MRMRPYTVVLQYPSSMCDDNEHAQTYMTCVNAATPRSALSKARLELCNEVNVDERRSHAQFMPGVKPRRADLSQPRDFFCICVILGEHNDLNPE